jgi:hypothetical protein
MLRIRAREHADAAVNRTAAQSWGRKVLAPRIRFELALTGRQRWSALALATHAICHMNGHPCR